MDGDNNQQPGAVFSQPAADPYASTARPEVHSSEELDAVSWSASEFIEHQKTTAWFMLLAVSGFVIAAMVYLMTRDWFGPVIIALLALVFGLGAARRPRVLDYSLDKSGLTVDKKRYPYEDFRAFTVLQEGSIESVLLLPAKRWMPPLSIYFAPEQADQIVDTLSAFVPFEERNVGYVDRFLHKIRF